MIRLFIQNRFLHKLILLSHTILTQMTSGHILKFLSNERPPILQSRRVFPQQKNGYSKQAPQWFKRKFSLESDRGYQYKHDHAQIKSKFNYLSQMNCFNVSKQYEKIEQKDKKLDNPVHNLKKGLLSEYLDNNAWMKQTVPLTGFERSKQGRKLNHRERQKRIESAQLKSNTYIAAKTASNFYSTQRSTSLWNQSDFRTTPKNNNFPSNGSINITGHNTHQRSRSISALMGEKEKIRSQRNGLAINKIHKIQKFKLTQSMKLNNLRTVDAKFIKDKMAMTAMNWAGRNISPEKSIQRFDIMIGQNAKVKRPSGYKSSLINKRVNDIQQIRSPAHIANNNFLTLQLQCQ